MDERMRFQTNKENLEVLVNRFRMDFGEGDIDLLEYFVKYAQEKILINEQIDRLQKYLDNVYYYDGDYDPIEEVIKLLEFKTENEKGFIDYYRKMKYPKQSQWKRIVGLNNRLNESILMDEELSIKEISNELNDI